MGPSACKLFTGIYDPRVVGRTTHGLAEISFAALCATLCGFGCCDGYAQFARAKVDVLRRYLPNKGGTPSHDTFGRLFRLIKPEQLEAVLADLARPVTAGSRVTLGSAGQIAVDDKFNEITALPDLLGLLDLSVIGDHPRRGCDVTMDALHTQRTSAKLLYGPERTTSWP